MRRARHPGSATISPFSQHHPCFGAPSISAKAILEELKPLGQESYKKILLRHGAKEPIYGVKVADMKKIQKRVKKDYKLALELFDTGVFDAMYLAGLIADDHAMTKKDLKRCVEKATSQMISEYTVRWVAAEGQFGREMAPEWIESMKEAVAAVCWATMGNLVALKDDNDLDLAEIKKLPERVQKTIDD
jgi:3-methyladenine DNA glycosylase AlkD